jgi:hypothetical protein
METLEENNILDIKEYETILNNIKSKNEIEPKLIEKKEKNLKTKEDIYFYDNCKLSIFKSASEQPAFNVFDDFAKYITSIISKTVYIQTIYELFAEDIVKEMKKNKVSSNDYILYTKGSLVFRNKLDKFIKSGLIKNDGIRNIMKNIICLDKFNCINPILNESDFDVNCIIFNNDKREHIKNIVAKVLINIKNKLDNDNKFINWIDYMNKHIHNSVLNVLKKNRLQTTANTKKKLKNKNNRKSKRNIKGSNELNVKSLRKNGKMGKIKTFDNEEDSNSSSKSEEYFTMNDESENKKLTEELFQNKRLKFADYEQTIELMKDLNQNRKSFYINNIKPQGYTVLAEIKNFHNLDSYFDDIELNESQCFVSMNENIQHTLENNNFKKHIHFDLYRLKLNFSFYFKYSNNNVFKKNITGEIIDVSFPYRNNAYFSQDPVDYEDKLMVSQTYKGLNEFNVWGIINDLVETIEIESINISKPNKFEKRINRFIMIRFLEYWFRIPFRINKDLSERTFQNYNLNIKNDGQNFNTYFNKRIYRDYEFSRIKNCLERNQNINIYYMYRKFLRNEPYQTIFKLSRSELDNAIGIKQSDLKSLRELINNHREIYSIFFDIPKN